MFDISDVPDLFGNAAAAQAQVHHPIRYRIESNVDRTPGSQWFDYRPTFLCGAMNLNSYHAGRGGEWGVYDSHGDRA